ncbi:hypothetical protein [Alkalihalobacillus trypoxylicola]|uniref:Uncharacterized protein n=1 Tax=Alkalihalobacillus trypoxylicola TaxID=519424 RepID=A0A161PCD7_9BACI|nr:hypothetical protein [Alkalihalobacillus trypoxylicola]KYG30046.1 hypothetical protein AZF04_20085 [Alkalihalobacillus trypoxylicola]
MKLGKFLLTTIVITLTFVCTDLIAFAEEETTVKELEKVGVNIEVFQDGRVKPIDENAMYTEVELDEILKEIGYPDNYISTLPKESKRTLISKGGKIVDTDVELTHNYISKDGNQYEVTDNNKSEIKAIQKEDLKSKGIKEDELHQYNLANDDISLFNCSHPFEGMCVHDDWSGLLMTLYKGETSTSYIYEMILDATWQKGTTNVNFGDAMALHWGEYGQPVPNSQEFIFFAAYNDLTQTRESFTPRVNNGNGIGHTFFLLPTNTQNVRAQGGVLSQDIYIAKSYNHELTVTAEYVHPWLPANLSVGVNVGGIDISWNVSEFFGDTWSWQVSLIPQRPMMQREELNVENELKN